MLWPIKPEALAQRACLWPWEADTHRLRDLRQLLCALVFSATKWDAQGCGNGVSYLTPGTKQSAWPVASLMGVFAAAATFSIVTVFRVEKLSLRPTGSHPLCEEGSWRETLGGGLPEAEFPGLSPGILSCQPWGDK